MTSYSQKTSQIRKKANSNLFFFSKDILGYDLIRKNPHQELCHFLEREKNPKKLILLPRGAFKSTVITVGYTMHSLMNNPNDRILISSETFAQSKTFLSAIKTHIESNDTFRAIYGDQKKPDSVWRQEELTVVGRTKVAREPSISVSGVGQTRVGMHYDKIILDDVVSNNNINTPEQIMKIIDHYRLLLSILDPGGELIIVGTRYSFADLYGHLLEEEKGTFAELIRSCYNQDGSLYFPSRLTKKFLEAQRKSQGASHFANQYRNCPVDQDSAVFRTDWLRYYKQPPQDLNIFLLIDPASTDNKLSDFTGIIICGVDSKNNIFVLEAINNKSSIGSMVELVFEKVKEYGIHKSGCVGLEVNANQMTYQYIFTEEMNKQNFYFPITELKPNSTRSKAARIKALQPWFENGKVYLRKDMTEFLHQITMYPRIRYDDLIDSFANILQVMTPATETVEDKWDKCTLSENEKKIWQEKENIGKRMVKRTKYRC